MADPVELVGTSRIKKVRMYHVEADSLLRVQVFAGWVDGGIPVYKWYNMSITDMEAPQGDWDGLITEINDDYAVAHP